MSAYRDPVVARVRELDDISVADVTGELDLGCEEELRAGLAAAWERSSGRLVANLSAVTFVDVRGLHVLLDIADVAQKDGGGFVIAAPPRSLRRMTELLHTSAPASYDSLASALDALATGPAGRPQ